MQYVGGENILSNGSYSFTNPVFASLAGYSSMALLKMLSMSTYTLIQRFRSGCFPTSEDDVYKKLCHKLGFNDTNSTNKANIVERARNNHLNDLENIIPFIITGLFYVGTRPKFNYAIWHFRIFLLSRILHTIAYQASLPQPTRTISWLIGYSSTISMLIPVFRSIQF